jgi:hypothetical protein
MYPTTLLVSTIVADRQRDAAGRATRRSAPRRRPVAPVTRAIRSSAILLLLVVLVLGWAFAAGPSNADAHPFRGSIRWSVVLCRASDSGAPPYDRSYYERLFFGTLNGGAANYWNNVSYGGVDFQGSAVRGWFTEPLTAAQEAARPRDQRYADCLDAARNARSGAYTPPRGDRVAVVTFPGNDLFGFPGGAYLPYNLVVGQFEHEGGHGIGLNHSFSDDSGYRNAEWSAPGEYDDEWDIMSWAHTHSTLTPSFGAAGPGLNAYHVDRMGWLPRGRILTFGADGTISRRVTIAPLNRPEKPGALLVRVPFDPADPFHYYTVEYRQNRGWDAGIPRSTVLIHEIRRRTDSNGRDDPTYYSFLLRGHTGTRDPLQTFVGNDVRISVVSSSPNGAVVDITSQIATRCLPGAVWRAARPSDEVCVSPDARRRVSEENAHAAEHRQSGGGASGPDTCRQGYVWRDAFAGDRVCVSGDARAQARRENEASAGLKNPARLVFGPNTCGSGYVWREADASDWVCVSTERRRETREDNRLAASRRSPAGGAFGRDTCRPGYVWRDAFPGDHVCVAREHRRHAQEDDEQAESRLMRP